MEIIIKETGEKSNLQIMDLKTGCEWTADLISAADFEHDENGNAIMSVAARRSD